MNRRPIRHHAAVLTTRTAGHYDRYSLTCSKCKSTGRVWHVNTGSLHSAIDAFTHHSRFMHGVKS